MGLEENGLVIGFDEKNTWVLIGKPLVLMGAFHGFSRKTMGLMGRFGFYRFLIGFYKFY